MVAVSLWVKHFYQSFDERSAHRAVEKQPKAFCPYISRMMWPLTMTTDRKHFPIEKTFARKTPTFSMFHLIDLSEAERICYSQNGLPGSLEGLHKELVFGNIELFRLLIGIGQRNLRYEEPRSPRLSLLQPAMKQRLCPQPPIDSR